MNAGSTNNNRTEPSSDFYNVNLRKLAENFAHLGHLRFEGLGLKGSVIAEITKRKVLVYNNIIDANFSGNRIEDEFIQILDNLCNANDSLIKVSFASNPLNLEGKDSEHSSPEIAQEGESKIQVQSKWRWLSSLDVSGCKLSNEDIEWLVKEVSQHAPLCKSINISNQFPSNNRMHTSSVDDPKWNESIRSYGITVIDNTMVDKDAGSEEEQGSTNSGDVEEPENEADDLSNPSAVCNLTACWYGNEDCGQMIESQIAWNAFSIVRIDVKNTTTHEFLDILCDNESFELSKATPGKVVFQSCESLIDWIVSGESLSPYKNPRLYPVASKGILVIKAAEGVGTDDMEDQDELIEGNDEDESPDTEILVQEEASYHEKQELVGKQLFDKICARLSDKEMELFNFTGIDFYIMVPVFKSLQVQTISRVESLKLCKPVEAKDRVLLATKASAEALRNTVKERMKDKKRLQVVIVDECHYSPTENTHGIVLTDTDILQASNVLFILSSATPLNCLTSKSRIPEANIVHWGHEDDPTYYGFDKYIDSMGWSYREDLVFVNKNDGRKVVVDLSDAKVYKYHEYTKFAAFLRSQLLMHECLKPKRINASVVVLGKPKDKSEEEECEIKWSGDWKCELLEQMHKNGYLCNPTENIVGCVPLQHQACRGDDWLESLVSGQFPKGFNLLVPKSRKSNKQSLSTHDVRKVLRLFMLIADYIFSMLFYFFRHFDGGRDITQSFIHLAQLMDEDVRKLNICNSDCPDDPVLKELFSIYLKRAKKKYKKMLATLATKCEEEEIFDNVIPIKLQERRHRHESNFATRFYTETDRIIDDWFSGFIEDRSPGYRKNPKHKGNMIVMRVYYNVQSDVLSSMLNIAVKALALQFFGSSSQPVTELPIAINDTGSSVLKTRRLPEWMQQRVGEDTDTITYQHLIDLPILVVLTEKGRMGDTFPHSVCTFDFRLRQGGLYTTLVQELGRMCRYPALEENSVDVQDIGAEPEVEVDTSELERHFVEEAKRLRVEWEDDESNAVIQDVLSVTELKLALRTQRKKNLKFKDAKWLTHRLPVAIMKTSICNILERSLAARWEYVVKKEERLDHNTSDAELTQVKLPANMPDKVPAWSAVDCIPIGEPMPFYDSYVSSTVKTKDGTADKKKIDAKRNKWHSYVAYRKLELRESEKSKNHYDVVNKNKEVDDLRFLLKARCQIGKTGAYLNTIKRLKDSIVGVPEGQPNIPDVLNFQSHLSESVPLQDWISPQSAKGYTALQFPASQQQGNIHHVLIHSEGFGSLVRVSVPKSGNYDSILEKLMSSNSDDSGESIGTTVFVIATNASQGYHNYSHMLSKDDTPVFIVESNQFHEYSQKAVAGKYLVIEVPLVLVDKGTLHSIDKGDRFKHMFAHYLARKLALQEAIVMSDTVVACYDFGETPKLVKTGEVVQAIQLVQNIKSANTISVQSNYHQMDGSLRVRHSHALQHPFILFRVEEENPFSSDYSSIHETGMCAVYQIVKPTTDEVSLADQSDYEDLLALSERFGISEDDTTMNSLAPPEVRKFKKRLCGIKYQAFEFNCMNCTSIDDIRIRLGNLVRSKGSTFRRHQSLSATVIFPAALCNTTIIDGDIAMTQEEDVGEPMQDSTSVSDDSDDATTTSSLNVAETVYEEIQKLYRNGDPTQHWKYFSVRVGAMEQMTFLRSFQSEIPKSSQSVMEDDEPVQKRVRID